MKASGKGGSEDDVKAAILPNFIGEDTLDLFHNTFNLSDADKKCEKKILEAFEKYCVPKKNVMYERLQLYKIDKKKGEPFEQFLTNIKRMSQTCEFDCLLDQMICDRIVMDVADMSLQERLLRTEGLTLNKAIDSCRAAEMSKSQAKSLQVKDASVEVVKVKKQLNKMKDSNDGENFKCRRCQKRHGPRECPAYGQKCDKCGLLKHFIVTSCEERLSQWRQGNMMEIKWKE